MAAPIVAGEAALLRATFPNLRNDKLVQHIREMSVVFIRVIRGLVFFSSVARSKIRVAD
jgi:hypothetical protein